MKTCFSCSHFLGGGDWGLCCDIRDILCYFDTEACNNYEKVDSDDCFKNYMIEVKGYSPEVADATIVYNDSDDWSEYNTYYYIEEMPYIKK